MSMPFLLKFAPGKPSLTNPQSILDFLVDWAKRVAAALTSLVTLDAATREIRSQQAETAQFFTSAIVVNTAVTRMRDLYAAVLDQTFTTALIQFDGASGPGRWMITGPDPIANTATAAAGMPITNLGGSIVLTGAQNIRQFAVTAESATALNMSITLYK